MTTTSFKHVIHSILEKLLSRNTRIAKATKTVYVRCTGRCYSSETKHYACTRRSEPATVWTEMMERKLKYLASVNPPNDSHSSCLEYGEVTTADGYKHPIDAKSHSFDDVLDYSCERTFMSNCPSLEDIKRRELFCREMQSHLRENCHESVRLQLFGSSSNGFGFPSSDVDICLTFDGHENDKTVSKSVLFPIADSLRHFSKCSEVSLISNAQVPIVKFTVKDEKFQAGDISLYNKLGISNTKLLHMYACLDRRCRILGYMFKQFSRRHGDVDVARMSSYANVIMVIHFLQQCDPPVLPVLQELYHSPKQPVIEIDGWNAWFFDSLPDVPHQWPGYGLNTDTVGGLWFKFLKYYAAVFDFDDYVISIRQKRLLHKEAKIRNLNCESRILHPRRKRRLHWHHWTKRTVLIEDPFDRCHNLVGNAVAQKDALENVVASIKQSYQKLESLKHAQ